MFIELSTLDELKSALTVPCCILFCHLEGCQHCTRLAKIVHKTCDLYESVACYGVEAQLLQEYRSSGAKHSFIEKVDGFPTTFLCTRGNEKNKIFGETGEAEMQAFFKEAANLLQSGSLLPCAVTQKEVSNFKHVHGKGYVIECTCFETAKTILPLKSLQDFSSFDREPASVNAIVLLTVDGPSKPRVTCFGTRPLGSCN